MKFLFFRAWGPALFPAILFVVCLVLLTAIPGSVTWSSYGTFTAIPYVLFGLAVLLGIFFAQSRLLFLSLLLGGITLFLQVSLLPGIDPARSGTMVFLSSVYVPPLTILFYHISERGVFNIHGLVRVLLIGSAVLVIALLPGCDAVNEAVANPRSALFRPPSPSMNIPLIGILGFVASVPFVLIRNKHESPYLGRLLGLGLLFVFTSLTFRSTGWRTGQAETVLLLFMAGAGMTFVWSALESSWRSAHMDELTELPGRRSLKHRLASLTGGFSLAVLDIDFFKKINDRYGHDTGDQVLRFMASQLRKWEKGRAYRYGGEEFVMVGEDVSLAEMTEAMEKLREQIERSRFIVRSKDRPLEKPEGPRPAVNDVDERAIRITVSIGVAAHGDKYGAPQEVLYAADKAVYKAKKAGRNCVKSAR